VADDFMLKANITFELYGNSVFNQFKISRNSKLGIYLVRDKEDGIKLAEICFLSSENSDTTGTLHKHHGNGCMRHAHKSTNN
jgi:hypothetical protein